MNLEGFEKWNEANHASLELLKLHIKKDLEYNYRLPENILTIIAKSINKVLIKNKIILDNESLIEFLSSIEVIIQSNQVNDAESLLNTIIYNVNSYLIEKNNSIVYDITEFKSQIQSYIDKIYLLHKENLNKNHYLINPESHFENGYYLHSTQYYFAKRYFTNSENCDNLAKLLANKLVNLKFTSNITLVGFRSYTGMLLNKTRQIFQNRGIKINYTIIEPIDENEFTWQFIPDFNNINTEFLVVLPITCTCSTYIRIRKYLQRQIDNYIKIEFPQINNKKKWSVKRQFINVFLIQDYILENGGEYKVFNEKELLANAKDKELDEIDVKLSKLYSNFNWDRIKKNEVHFKNGLIHERNFVAHPLIKLYSNLTLPEECIHCFPKKYLRDEKNMFQTHDNFETPNLIQNFPNFGKNRPNPKLLNAHFKHLQRKDLLFTKLFPTDNPRKSSHHYGHISVNGKSYLNYIRGNTFFEQNRGLILSFFDEIFLEILFENKKYNKRKNVIFITSESKYNSTFLEEIIDYKKGKTDGAFIKWKKIGEANDEVRSVSILRIDSRNEFIDNFMVNYIDLFRNRYTLIIYFEDVLSSGVTFKLLSNYLKHYKNIEYQHKELRHGFDFILSILDRTPYYTHEELLKKLYSKNSLNIENRFISFFKLNVPVVAAAHLGDPLTENVRLIHKLMRESYLDIVKRRIGKEVPNKIALKLTEENVNKNNNTFLKYFPFEDENENLSNYIFEKNIEITKNSNLELLKLYAAHEINTILANNKKSNTNLENLAESNGLVDYIVKIIVSDIESNKETFFVSSNYLIENKFNLEYDYKLIKSEYDVVHDTVLKIITRHPFTYYTKIYESIFKYCIRNYDSLISLIISKENLPSFLDLRKLKFYIRRLVDLNSSFLISSQSVKLLAYLYKPRFSGGANRVVKLLELIQEEIKANSTQFYDSQTLLSTKNRNLQYKYNSINSLFSFFIYSFKESVFKNHYRSIKLEGILNDYSLLPSLVTDSSEAFTSIFKQLKDPYYQISGIIKSENLLLLKRLKNLHLKKYIIYRNTSDDIMNSKKYSIHEKEEMINSLKRTWLDPASGADIKRFYFESWKNDPIIINANKFVINSKFSQQPRELDDIKLAISNMLKASTVLLDKNSPKDGKGFIESIHEVLNTIVSIVQPGLEEFKPNNGDSSNNLGYALCIKYNDISLEKSTLDNLYVIASDKSTRGRKINSNGLIYNLINGLYTAKVNTNIIDDEEYDYSILGEQSLLIGIKEQDKWYSFNDEYYIKNSDDVIDSSTPYSFSELIDNDFKNEGNKLELPFLDNTSMIMFFRLAELDESKMEYGKCDLEGKALLVITCNLPFDRKNLLKFIEDEKLRLLFLIKDELLNYLRRITTNNTFYSIIKSEELLNYQSAINHGLEDYFDYQDKIIEYGVFNNTTLNILKSINTAIKCQIIAYDFLKNVKNKSYNTFALKERIVNILESNLIAGKSVSKTNYTIQFHTMEEIFIDSFILDIVLLELIINAKRHSPNVGSDIRIYLNSSSISIRNNKRYSIYSSSNRRRRGLEMCREICDNLDYKLKVLINNDSLFEIMIIK